MANGRITRLPEEIRDGIYFRLRDGRTCQEVANWLNELPEAREVQKEYYGGRPIMARQVLDWRRVWYERSEKRLGKASRVRDLAAVALSLARANGDSIARGAAAIVSGKILELLEQVDSATKMDVSELKGICAGLAQLRTSEIAQQRADMDIQWLKRKDKELATARGRVQWMSVERFREWAEDEGLLKVAKEPGLSNDEKIERMGRLMYRDLWEGIEPADDAYGGN